MYQLFKFDHKFDLRFDHKFDLRKMTKTIEESKSAGNSFSHGDNNNQHETDPLRSKRLFVMKFKTPGSILSDSEKLIIPEMCC